MEVTTAKVATLQRVTSHQVILQIRRAGSLGGTSGWWWFGVGSMDWRFGDEKRFVLACMMV